MNSVEPASYFLMRNSSGAIGYDGAGAIDLDRSETEVIILRKIDRLMNLEELRLKDTADEIPNIVMRRGTRPFDLYYNEKLNSLIANANFLAENSIPIIGSVRQLTPVRCHFGGRSGDYMFGNLVHYHCRDKSTVWDHSKFIKVANDRFQMNFTHIEDGRVSVDHEVAYDGRGLQFRDSAEYIEARRMYPLDWLIPEHLCLQIKEPCAILNLSSAQTLVRKDIVELVRNARRPKSRVPGMIFAPPEVEVTFLSVEDKR